MDAKRMFELTNDLCNSSTRMLRRGVSDLPWDTNNRVPRANIDDRTSTNIPPSIPALEGPRRVLSHSRCLGTTAEEHATSIDIVNEVVTINIRVRHGAQRTVANLKRSKLRLESFEMRLARLTPAELTA